MCQVYRMRRGPAKVSNSSKFGNNNWAISFLIGIGITGFSAFKQQENNTDDNQDHAGKLKGGQLFFKYFC